MKRFFRIVTAIALVIASLNGIARAEEINPDDPVMVIEVAGQTQGVIEIELFKDLAPRHVERLVTLANEGAYDNVVFHRVIDGFMAQTGDVKYGKRGNELLGKAGQGGSDLPDLKAEFSDRSYEAGIVGMARSMTPDSANSQFFIMFDTAWHLNGQYTVIGKVISGMDVVHAIKKGSRVKNGTVTDPDYMKSVHIKPRG